jgi:hypothetical protein
MSPDITFGIEEKCRRHDMIVEIIKPPIPKPGTGDMIIVFKYLHCYTTELFVLI